MFSILIPDLRSRYREQRSSDGGVQPGAAVRPRGVRGGSAGDGRVLPRRLLRRVRAPQDDAPAQRVRQPRHAPAQRQHAHPGEPAALHGR